MLVFATFFTCDGPPRFVFNLEFAFFDFQDSVNLTIATSGPQVRVLMQSTGSSEQPTAYFLAFFINRYC